MIGDFNAKVGGHQQGDGAAVGQYGNGERNKRGSRLVQFATSEYSTISNTCFKKRTSRKRMWRSPNGLVTNEIDYILTNKKSITKNVEVIQRVNVGSDHWLVRGTIKTNTGIERNRRMRPGKSKVNIDLLLLKEEFRLELQNCLEVLREEREEDLEEMVSKITNAIKESALDTAGRQREQKNEKLNSKKKIC